MNERQTTDSDSEPVDMATILRSADIRKRMRCSGTVAHNIRQAFTTVPQLIDAIQSNEPLSSYDGIGPKTADAITEWWEHREERERNMPSSSVTERSLNAATITVHESWADELGIELNETDSEEN